MYLSWEHRRMLGETGWPTVDVIFRSCVAGSSPFKPQTKWPGVGRLCSAWKGHAHRVLLGFWLRLGYYELLWILGAYKHPNNAGKRIRDQERASSFSCIFKVCVWKFKWDSRSVGPINPTVPELANVATMVNYCIFSTVKGKQDSYSFFTGDLLEGE